MGIERRYSLPTPSEEEWWEKQEEAFLEERKEFLRQKQEFFLKGGSYYIRVSRTNRARFVSLDLKEKTVGVDFAGWIVEVSPSGVTVVVSQEVGGKEIVKRIFVEKDGTVTTKTEEVDVIEF